MTGRHILAAAALLLAGSPAGTGPALAQETETAARNAAAETARGIVAGDCPDGQRCEHSVQIFTADLNGDGGVDFLLSVPPLTCPASTCETYVHLAAAGAYRRVATIQGYDIRPGVDRHGGHLNILSGLFHVGEAEEDAPPYRVVANAGDSTAHVVYEIWQWTGSTYAASGVWQHGITRLMRDDGLAWVPPDTEIRAAPSVDGAVLARFPERDAYLELLARPEGDGDWRLVRMKRLEGTDVIGYVRAAALDERQ